MMYSPTVIVTERLMTIKQTTGQSRAGSSMRLGRLKPQGPDHPVQRKFTKDHFGPELSRKKICGLLKCLPQRGPGPRGPQSLSCLRARRDHDPAPGQSNLTKGASPPHMDDILYILYNVPPLPPPPQNCPFAWWDLDLPSLGPSESTTRTASRSVQPFLQGSRS